MDKKKSAPVKIPINEVADIEYGSVFKHIQGTVINKINNTKVGFALAPQEFENLKKALNTIRYGG